MRTGSSQTNGPVFIVGSPRSGTSILTWCLGQHPNLLGLEESNWMTSFAADVGVAFARGTARGERSQLSSMGMNREYLMEAIGGCLNQSILAHRTTFEQRRTELTRPGSAEVHPAFKIARSDSDPKSRFVNGTPEYSLEIGGLRKLFPGARFIHLLRNCDEVVRSMVQFDRVAGTKLVADEQHGYQEWLRSVRACSEAEKAYGPEVVRRFHYDELVSQSESTIRVILDFLGEPFSPSCLDPLGKRINSSRVTAESIGDAPSPTRPSVHEAREFWAELRRTPAPLAPSPEAAERLEQAFEERVAFLTQLDTEYARAQRVVADLQKELAERTAWGLRWREKTSQKDALLLQLEKELDSHFCKIFHRRRRRR